MMTSQAVYVALESEKQYQFTQVQFRALRRSAEWGSFFPAQRIIIRMIYYWKDQCFTHQESASHIIWLAYNWRKTILHTNDPRDVAHKMAHTYRVSSQAFIRIYSKGRVAKYFNHYNAPGRQKLHIQTIETEIERKAEKRYNAVNQPRTWIQANDL